MSRYLHCSFILYIHSTYTFTVRENLIICMQSYNDLASCRHTFKYLKLEHKYEFFQDEVQCTFGNGQYH